MKNFGTKKKIVQKWQKWNDLCAKKKLRMTTLIGSFWRWFPKGRYISPIKRKNDWKEIYSSLNLNFIIHDSFHSMIQSCNASFPSHLKYNKYILIIPSDAGAAWPWGLTAFGHWFSTIVIVSKRNYVFLSFHELVAFHTFPVSVSNQISLREAKKRVMTHCA